jgi:hypothetical protein
MKTIFAVLALAILGAVFSWERAATRREVQKRQRRVPITNRTGVFINGG